MLNTIDKDSKIALSEQVSEKIIASIRSGHLKPGKRILGIRLLAKEFGTSNSTIIAALDTLEKQNYIERIPARGTFVSADVNHELKTTRIIFPFPESSINLKGGLENWGGVTEFYRGILTEAAKLNAEIHFLHFEEAKDEIDLARQLRRLNDFDAGIFCGNQLRNLRDALIARNKPCACLGNWPTSGASIASDRDAAFDDIASLLEERGYKKLRILLPPICEEPLSEKNKKDKIDRIIRAVNARGIIADTSMIHELKDTTDVTIDAAFAKILPDLKGRHEAFFPFDADTVLAIYRYAARKSLKIGEDFGVFSYAGGISFSNLIPEFTFSKIHHFEMGKAACRIMVNAIHGGEWRGKIEKISNTLIINQSI